MRPEPQPICKRRPPAWLRMVSCRSGSGGVRRRVYASLPRRNHWRGLSRRSSRRSSSAAAGRQSIKPGRLNG